MGAKRLFEPGRIGKLSIKNKLVMAPMLAFGLFEMDGRISQRGIDYYVERAKGGVGLIITGAFFPTLAIEFKRMAEIGVVFVPRADTPEVIPRLRELVEAVHSYDVKIAIQLTAGTGRVLHPTAATMAGIQCVAPSVVPNVWDTNVMTRELTIEEVEELIKSFGDAAEILRSAGVDAIELHGHEGYLMDQFTTALWNKRKDKYGGDLDSRLRFPFEIIENIKNRAGKEFPVIYRYAITHHIEGGRDIEESLEVARRLEQAGVDALHVDAGCYDDWYWPHPPGYQPPGCMVDLAEKVKSTVNIPIITVGRLGYPDLAEKVIQEGKADFVALGRPLLADPEWPIKAKEERSEDIRPCIGDHDGCLGFARGYLSCTVNPACGRERELVITPAEKVKSVWVIGGGIAGMEAARVAALRGYKVTLHEKGTRLGGHLIAGSVPEFKRDIGTLRDYYVAQIGKLGVKIELGKEVTPKLVEEMKPEVVIIATGSTPIIPDIPGIERDGVITAIDILLGKREAGDMVIVVGGGMVGCETAVYLAQQGKRVTIVEALSEIIPDLFEANKQYLFKMLAENGVSVLTDTALGRVTKEGIIAVNKRRRYEAELKADTVVLALGLESQRELAKALEGKVAELHAIGDCARPRKIIDAIWDAFNTMRVI